MRAGIVVPSLVSCQRQFRAAAILPPLISRSNQNDSRDFVRRFGPLGVHQLRVMQLRLNANELTLDRKWLYAPLAANSKAITIPFFLSPLINLSSSSFRQYRESISTRRPNILPHILLRFLLFHSGDFIFSPLILRINIFPTRKFAYRIPLS